MIRKTIRIVGAVLAIPLLLVAYNVARHLVFWGSAETIRVSSGGVSIA